jgi:hypothetical protein
VRFWLGVIGFGGIYAILCLGALVPYAIIHDGLLMPLFACIVLGLGGENPLARALSVRPLVFVGEASYCLYLLHFSLWNIDARLACTECAGAEPVRSVAELRVDDRAWRSGGAAFYRETGATQSCANGCTRRRW